MKTRTRTFPRHRPAAQPPLPHPSWSAPVDGRRVTVQEFWQRLGL